MSGRNRVAVATSSSLAADAAREVSEHGGNAVDCAVAAAMIAMNTEPGVCALAGGAYITIWPPSGDPVTIDGGVAVPGKDLDDRYAPNDGTALHMEYGGGVDTIVGCASVAVPGALAACDRATASFGNVPWQKVLEPAVRAARNGFPLPNACHYYLEYSGEPIYCRSADGKTALFDDSGNLRSAGDNIVVPGLSDTLAEIAEGGARVFYEGRLARAIVAHVREGGGKLTAADLADYRAVERAALTTTLNDWTIAVNPPPAVGGAVLAALLMTSCTELAGLNFGEPAVAAAIIAAQQAALGYRKSHLDNSLDVSQDAAAMLELAINGTLLNRHMSAATVHTSTVDASGLACSITSSAGYGSGEIPAGTGLWLNNCLGELELNKRGLDIGPPGARLPSNMTPGVARRNDAILAFGSPGADRITTALQQFLLYHLLFEQTLEGANAAPRLHVEVGRPTPSVSVEAGVPMLEPAYPVRSYADRNMYFGGVGAASLDPENGLTASADPRRVGSVYVSPG